LLEGTSGAAPFVARQLAETFTTATDADVQDAASHNYRSLLRGFKEGDRKDDPTIGDGDCTPENREHLLARLGAVRVPPHRQPGIEPPARPVHAAPTPAGRPPPTAPQPPSS
jgi:hypothetical protein